MKDKMLLSISEVAAVLGISRPSIYRLIHTANFPIIRLGGRVLVPMRQLQEWLDAQISNQEVEDNA